MNLKEIVFEVEPAEEGGFTASCKLTDGLIATEGDTWEELESMIRDAVACHFGDPAAFPDRIRLYLKKDRVLVAA